ncbi:unnamed protein product [Spirodela intermedia]|uniref:Uncharacterized protein n=1 Tax=Spirodela intermedia TaxID=51605 RepID=A0A7I8L6R1_SPIIN|nr:unnamed protein product [Spirodela intermedia]
MVEAIAGEGELNQMNVNWTRGLVGDILLALSDRGASAVQFFNWISKSQQGFRADPVICNLFVDNLGRLENYERMTMTLKELSRGGHCLTEKAFTFLKLLLLRRFPAAKDSVRRVVAALKAAGGTCRGTGIFSLVKLLSDSGFFDLAIFVMEEIAARRASYYNALIAAKCRSGDFQDAHQLLDEMRCRRCGPTVSSYNYLLGSLFKNNKFPEACRLLVSMEDAGYAPDPLTFEVAIVHACRVNRIDFAGELLARMLSEGVPPRLSTHAAFIKGYFWCGRAEEARKYVETMKELDRCAANANYSLLASLLRINGRVAEAAALLLEMMVAENLRPNFSVYVKVTKDLYRAGGGELAAALKRRFSEFPQISPDRRSSTSST